ncbi:MAG TPA: ABC transporter substrate-binding protein, partial [Prevotella sp.]|nr:ABC transporter substrate-binding protein [Prevotella sp.]
MMSNIMANRQKVLAYVALALGLAQIGIMLTAWLLTAAWPEDFTRSFLSAEGVRWFFGKFQTNLASPVLVWLLVCSIAWGAYRQSHIREYDRREYRQRFAMGVTMFELTLAVLVMLALTMLPHAILLNVMGGLLPSSFSQSIIPYCAFSVTLACCSFA